MLGALVGLVEMFFYTGCNIGYTAVGAFGLKLFSEREWGRAECSGGIRLYPVFYTCGDVCTALRT